jgi:serine protease
MQHRIRWWLLGLVAAVAVVGASLPGMASAGSSPTHHLIRGIYLHVKPVNEHNKPAITVPYKDRKQINRAGIPLLYHGGPVQHDPQIFVIYWGLWWSSTCTGQQGNGGGDEAYLDAFYRGQGTSTLSGAGDFQSPVDSQYPDSTGNYPQFPASAGQSQITENVYCSDPPASATDAQLAAVAVAYGNFLQGEGFSITNDTQIVVVSPSGTNPGGGFGSQYCAYHNVTPYSGSQLLSWTNLPYMPDQGGNCGAFFVQNADDGWSIVGGHEFNESVTDPFVNNQSAWYDANGEENGDKCAWMNLYAENLGTGSFAMQPEWDNRTANCQSSATYTHGSIRAVNSTALCVQDSAVNFGQQAILHSPCASTAQKAGTWVKYPDGTLRRYNSTGACLQPTSTVSGAPVVVGHCNNSFLQHWQWQSSPKHWLNLDTGRCLKAPSLTSNAHLVQAACSTSGQEKFTNV